MKHGASRVFQDCGNGVSKLLCKQGSVPLCVRLRLVLQDVAEGSQELRSDLGTLQTRQPVRRLLIPHTGLMRVSYPGSTELPKAIKFLGYVGVSKQFEELLVVSIFHTPKIPSQITHLLLFRELRVKRINLPSRRFSSSTNSRTLRTIGAKGVPPVSLLAHGAHLCTPHEHLCQPRPDRLELEQLQGQRASLCIWLRRRPISVHRASFGSTAFGRDTNSSPTSTALVPAALNTGLMSYEARCPYGTLSK